MATELDNFLASIAPSRTLDAVARTVDETLIALPLASTAVRSGTELRDVLVRAWRHFHGYLWGQKAPMPEINPELEWDQCQQILNAMYRRDHGWRSALEIARTGVEGGLLAVLKELLEKAAEQYVEHLIDLGVRSLLHLRPYDQQIALITEYLQKYGALLPSTIRSQSPKSLLADFPWILRGHPRMLQRAARLGRS